MVSPIIFSFMYKRKSFHHNIKNIKDDKKKKIDTTIKP